MKVGGADVGKLATENAQLRAKLRELLLERELQN